VLEDICQQQQVLAAKPKPADLMNLAAGTRLEQSSLLNRTTFRLALIKKKTTGHSKTETTLKRALQEPIIIKPEKNDDFR